MSSCQCYEEPIRNYYCYYDTPEGADIDKKMMVTTRYGVIAGLILSTYDVLLHSHASGLGPILKRYAVHTIPLGLMGATFAGVANGAMITRKKDDVYNYFLGGFACGPILAYYLGSKHAVLLGGIALGIAGMIKKNAVENEYTLVPHIPGHRNNVWKWRMDFTLAEDPFKEPHTVALWDNLGREFIPQSDYTDGVIDLSFKKFLGCGRLYIAEMEKLCAKTHSHGQCGQKK